MKKLILIFIAVISIFNIGNAQGDGTSFRERLSFGIKAGFNYSNVYDTEGEAFIADSKFGFATGAFLSIPIGSFLGIQPEVLFSQKGFKGSGSILGNTYSLTRTSNYIDLPLLLAVKPVDFFTILAGPQYSFLIKQTDKFGSIEQERDFDNDNIRKNTLAFTGGVDISIKNFVIGTRAGWDLQRNNGDGSSTTPRYRNMWYQATLGLKF